MKLSSLIPRALAAGKDAGGTLEIIIGGRATKPVSYHLLPTGNLIALASPSEAVEGQRGLNGQAAACFELDWDSNEVWTFEDPWIHHDYERLPNGNTLLVKWAPLPKGLVRRVKGGYNDPEDDPKHMLGDMALIIFFNCDYNLIVHICLF